MRTRTLLMKDHKPTFHPTEDNGKIGAMLGISYLPGSDYMYLNSGLLTSDCKGTCGSVDCSGCIGSCYAVSTVKRFEHANANRMENTMQLRSDIDQHFADIRSRAIEKGHKVIRYTESGEIENYRQFEKVVDLAESLPDRSVYLYTKNYAVLRQYFERHELPSNMVVLISIWDQHGVSEYEEFKHHDNVKAFVVNNDTYKVDAMCPAYREVNGKVKRINDDRVKCVNCKLCFSSKAKVIGCLEH